MDESAIVSSARGDDSDCDRLNPGVFARAPDENTDVDPTKVPPSRFRYPARALVQVAVDRAVEDGARLVSPEPVEPILA